MKKKEERVNPAEFKKTLNIEGVPDLQTALNVLELYQEWRTGLCGKSMYDLGLNPPLITSAIHYILGKFKAHVLIYPCYTCRYFNSAERVCIDRDDCHYERCKQ